MADEADNSEKNLPPFPIEPDTEPAELDLLKDTPDPKQYIALLPQDEQPDPKSDRDTYELKKITSILPYYDYQPDKMDEEDQEGPRPEEDEEYKDKLSDEMYEGREIADSLFTWQASNLYHNPLYFEDPPLERYGHTYHELAQPFVSVGKFGVQLIGLPYQMTIDPVSKKMYTLGWYRPGEVAPYKFYRVPWNTKAAIVEGGVLAGLVFLIP